MLTQSFAGCGFLGIYHIGVAAAFQHFMPDCHFSKLAGCSAGALAAAALVADIPVCESTQPRNLRSYHPK